MKPDPRETLQGPMAILAPPSDSVFDREIKWSASASAGDAHSHVGMDGYWRSAIVYWRRKVYVGARMLDDDEDVEDGVDDDVGQGFDGDGDDSMVVELRVVMMVVVSVDDGG